MPRYRIIKEVPSIIGYRDGKLYFREYYGGGKNWVWDVYREVSQGESLHLCTAEDSTMLSAMRKNGLTVRKDSGADAVLQSLVRKGFAERLPD